MAALRLHCETEHKGLVPTCRRCGTTYKLWGNLLNHQHTPGHLGGCGVAASPGLTAGSGHRVAASLGLTASSGLTNSSGLANSPDLAISLGQAKSRSGLPTFCGGCGKYCGGIDKMHQHLRR
jgi:hypothetical protein